VERFSYGKILGGGGKKKKINPVVTKKQGENDSCRAKEGLRGGGHKGDVLSWSRRSRGERLRNFWKAHKKTLRKGKRKIAFPERNVGLG